MTRDILDPNPFANSFLSQQGDPSPSEIHTAVGMALDNWEHCEASFGFLYSALVKPEGGYVALMRSFGTIAASATRRAMIWEACDAFFHFHPSDALKAETRHLLNLYENAASRRNEIAHACVMGVSLPLPTTWYLVPSLFSTRKNNMIPSGVKDPFGGMPKYRYASRDIYHFITCFQELGSRADTAMQSIRAFYAALPEGDRLP